MSALTMILAVVALLGSGLVGGVFFAFSSFIMKALAGVPAPEGIAAMQSINVTVINPSFLGAFLGTAVVSAVVALWAALNWGVPSAPYLLTGALAYFVGTFLVTMLGNVPLNNELAAVAATEQAAARFWAHYLDRWTLWNTVRTVAAVAAALLLTVGLLHGSST